MFDMGSSNYQDGGTSVSESFISRSLLWAALLWGLVAALVVASWAVWVATDSLSLSALLAVNASVAACGAAVAHIRFFVLRVAHLIRVTNAGPLDRSELRTVR